MASPFSQEFEVPGAWGYAVPYAAAVFGSQLWFIAGVAGIPLPMRQLKLGLVDSSGDPLQIETEVAKAANWSSTELSIPDDAAVTYSRCGVAPVGDALHLVWNSLGERNRLRASRYTMGGDDQPGWQRAVQLYSQVDYEFIENSELVAASSQADVSVTGFGDDTLIVACPNVRAWWLDREAPALYIGTFKVGEIDQQNGTSKAHSDIWGVGPGPPSTTSRRSGTPYQSARLPRLPGAARATNRKQGRHRCTCGSSRRQVAAR